jgi:hypothetical protein
MAKLEHTSSSATPRCAPHAHALEVVATAIRCLSSAMIHIVLARSTVDTMAPNNVPSPRESIKSCPLLRPRCTPRHVIVNAVDVTLLQLMPPQMFLQNDALWRESDTNSANHRSIWETRILGFPRATQASRLQQRCLHQGNKT